LSYYNHKNKITIFYLPTYSPEFNPDEYLNQDLSKEMLTKTIFLNKD